MTPPQYIVPLSDSPKTIRVGIQGAPGSGKTAAALTFPNPVFIPFDRTDIKGLLSLPHLVDVKPRQVPFSDREFIKTTLGFKIERRGHLDVTGALLKWLQEEGGKLLPTETLIIDSWTVLQDLLDNWLFAEPVHTARGTIDEFAPWQQKIDRSQEIMNALQQLSCNVVVLFHEVQERDKITGALLDKVQPLQQGKFIAKIKIYFPYFVRQLALPPKDKDGKYTEGNPYYWWQTKATEKFDPKWIGRVERDVLVEANYRSLV